MLIDRRGSGHVPCRPTTGRALTGSATVDRWATPKSSSAPHLPGHFERRLLVHEFPGATVSRAEREMLATAVSAANDCFFCMDSHGALATALLEASGSTQLASLVDDIKVGSSEGFDDKMRALLHIARTVGREPRELTSADVAAARSAGAADADVQLAVLIAAAFSMYNRMVEGFRAKTAPSADAYRARAEEIAAHGYSHQPAPSVPALRSEIGRSRFAHRRHRRVRTRQGSVPPFNGRSP